VPLLDEFHRPNTWQVNGLQYHSATINCFISTNKHWKSIVFFAKNVEKMPTMALPTGCWPSLSQNNLYVMGHGSKMNSFRMFFTIIGHHNCRMLMIFDEVCMDYYKKM